MAYALYSLTTGQIFNVLYQQPTNAAQLAAIAAQGLQFVQVQDGVSMSNSMIDLNTGQPLPTGTPMTMLYRHTYNPVTGALGSFTYGNCPNDALPVAAPGLIVSPTNLNLPGGQILTIDAKGNPVLDANGNYQVTPAPYVPRPPTPTDLLLLAAVNAGNLDPSIIPATTLSHLNANLATTGIATAAIAVPAQTAIPAAPATP
jgi:hypothetical protein